MALLDKQWIIAEKVSFAAAAGAAANWGTNTFNFGTVLNCWGVAKAYDPGLMGELWCHLQINVLPVTADAATIIWDLRDCATVDGTYVSINTLGGGETLGAKPFITGACTVAKMAAGTFIWSQPLIKGIRQFVQLYADIDTGTFSAGTASCWVSPTPAPHTQGATVI